MCEAKFVHVASLLRAQVSAAIRADEACFVEQCVGQQNHDFQHASGQKLWDTLRYHLPKWRKRREKPLRMCAAHETFTRHFAAIEDARVITLAEVAHECNQINAQALHHSMAIQHYLKDVPRRFELERAIRDMTNDKACAGTTVPEFLKASPAMAAEILMPVLTQAVLYAQQPSCHKGGFLFPLQKKAGPDYTAANHRAILVSEVVPRIINKIARRRLVQQVGPCLQPLQLGGL